jgi:hypothetical protein
LIVLSYYLTTDKLLDNNIFENALII